MKKIARLRRVHKGVSPSCTAGLTPTPEPAQRWMTRSRAYPPYIVAAVMALGIVSHASAQQPAKVDQATVDQVVAATFKGAPAEWVKRIEQDETQRLCSQYRNELRKDEFAKVLAREKASIVMPADGVVIGDWKAGEKIAQTGTGGQFSDRPETPKGANCYACHQLSRAELSFGTLGP